jgi:hypothetical protein
MPNVDSERKDSETKTTIEENLIKSDVAPRH